MPAAIPLVVAGIGLYASTRSSKAADRRASSAQASSDYYNEQALGLQRDQFDFDKQRYADSEERYAKWEKIYGPLQEDLGTYFKNLTGKTLSNREVSNIQAAGQKARLKISQSLAQSGRGNSGLEASLLARNDFQTELGKAQARSTADERAIAAKTNFLSIGLGQGNTLKNQSNGIAESIAQGAANQGNILSKIGQDQVNLATRQNAIAANQNSNTLGALGYVAGKVDWNSVGTAFSPGSGIDASSSAAQTGADWFS